MVEMLSRLLLFGCFIAAGLSQPVTPRVKYVHVISEIQSRFAMTDVLSMVENVADGDAEVVFNARLPDAAFISNFSMEINGVTTFGEIKEKEKAKQTYEDARSRGLSAGHVAESARETNLFTISVNVAARSKAKFNLTYQEVLKRVHGVYKHVVNIESAQQIDELQIDILIVEREKLTKLHVPEFGTKIGEKTNKELLDLPESSDVVKRTETAKGKGSVGFVSYSHPTSKKLPGAGQLVVLYDVDRDHNGGEIEVINGYFVHFFAPSNIEPGDKHVVFVLDKSGSMMGTKFAQLQEAMSAILKDLHPSDQFNVIMFSNDNQIWKPQSMLATAANVADADKWIKSKSAGGGTELQDAISAAQTLLAAHSGGNALTSSIIYLTDGQASVDVESLTKANAQAFSMHGIAFGDDADLTLLRRISSANHGLTRKIYEHADAPLQLVGFYREISTPLLRDVTVRYLNESVDVTDLVQAPGTGTVYYEGSEFMNVGRVTKGSADAILEAEISGRSKSGDVKLKAEKRLSSSVSRLVGGPDGVLPRPVPTHRPGPPFACHPVPSVAALHGRVASAGFFERFRHIPLCRNDTVPLNRPARLGATTVGGFVERMWAYLSVKKYLQALQVEDDQQKRKQLEAKALDISLDYGFVTKLTSMVVVPPNQKGAGNQTSAEDSVDEEDEEGELVVNPAASSDLVDASRAKSASRGRIPSRFAPHVQHLRGAFGGGFIGSRGRSGPRGGGFGGGASGGLSAMIAPPPRLPMSISGLASLGLPTLDNKLRPSIVNPMAGQKRIRPTVLPTTAQTSTQMSTNTMPASSEASASTKCPLHVILLVDAEGALKDSDKTVISAAVDALTQRLISDLSKTVSFAVYQLGPRGVSRKLREERPAFFVPQLFNTSQLSSTVDLDTELADSSATSVIVHLTARNHLGANAQLVAEYMKPPVKYLVLTVAKTPFVDTVTPTAVLNASVTLQQYRDYFSC